MWKISFFLATMMMSGCHRVYSTYEWWDLYSLGIMAVGIVIMAGSEATKGAKASPAGLLIGALFFLWG